MSTIISRTKAKRLTLVYQIAALLCVLGAVAIGVVGLPDSAATKQLNNVSQPPSSPIPGINTPIDQFGNPQPTTTQTKEEPVVRINPVSIAARFSMLDNAPQSDIPQETDLVVEAPVETETSTTTGTLAKRVRYTGYIQDSDQALAFIRIDGTQRIVAEGGTARAGSMGLDDLTIKAVRPKFILISDGTTDDRIQLADKTGPSITMSSADVVVETLPTREEDVVLTAEELERLEKMPARQRAMQERILRRQKMGKEMPTTRIEPQASFRAGFGNDRQRGNQENN
ncbi:MAG: hypothetical protein AB8C13_04560 [Phycisphaerales bacterium]